MRSILLLYPPAFRRRYRQELCRMTAAIVGERRRGSRVRLAWDLLSGALLAWLELAFRTESPLESLKTMTDRIFQELRLALRRLGRSPGFTIVAVVTVALAVGANTAVFTLVNGVLLRPLPYEDPGELGFVWSGLDWVGVPRAWISGPQVPFLREHADRFAGFAALQVVDVDLAGEPGQPSRSVRTGVVTGNLFRILGVEAALGRTLSAAEEGPGAPTVAVLTHELWQGRLEGDPAVLEREIRLQGEPYQVVGVLPEGFRFSMHSSLGDPRTPEVYVPLDDDFGALPPGNFSYALLARLADGEDWQRAVAQLDTLGRDFGDRHFARSDFRFRLVALHPDLVKDVRPALLMLLGAVGLVLAIACSNLATLFFGRALADRREGAVRAALGASGWSRLGPIVLESGLVAAAGGAAGVVLASAGTRLLLALAPGDLPRADDISPDWRVLVFSLAVTALVAFVIVLLPALRQRRLDLTAALREGGRSGTERATAQRAMVVLQVALSGLLLVAAGLMARSLTELTRVDPGFRTQGVSLADLSIPDYLYADDVEAVALFERVRERVLVDPGVAAAGWTGSPVLSGNANQRPYDFSRSPGASGDPAEDRVLTDSVVVSPGYFAAAGIELVAGRELTDADDGQGEPVVILDETLARRFWPDGGAVGGEVLVAWEEDPVAARVVGVVRHARLYDIRRDDRFQVYRPLRQVPARELTLAVRSEASTTPAGSLVAAVAEMDVRLGVSRIRRIEEVVALALSSWRFLLRLLAAFASVALILVALGLYGVVSLSVARQTRAIGIRMALGARGVEVGRAVVGQGIRLVLVGLAGSLLGAVALGGLLRGFLFGVSPLDPPSLAAMAGILLAVAAVASWLPARRATRVSPVEAFRDE